MGRSLSDRHALLVIGLSAALFLYSSFVHLVPAYNIVYVPLSATAALALWFLAARFGVTSAELGLERSSIASGLRWGAACVVIAAVIIAIGVGVPAFHRFFDDARVQDMSFGLLAYRALVRIPFGTALSIYTFVILLNTETTELFKKA